MLFSLSRFFFVILKQKTQQLISHIHFFYYTGNQSGVKLI
jgi:hypothetical protein